MPARNWTFPIPNEPVPRLTKRPPETTGIEGSTAFTAAYAAFSNSVYRAGLGYGRKAGVMLGSFQISTPTDAG